MKKMPYYLGIINNMHKVIHELELKVDDLENRSRRSNVITY